MPEESIFTIDVNVRPEQMRQLIERIQRYHLMLRPTSFKNIKRSVANGVDVLTFTYYSSDQPWEVRSEIRGEENLVVKMSPSSDAPDKALDDLKNSLSAVSRAIEQSLHQMSVNLLWIKGEKIVPEEIPSMWKRLVQRLFSRALLLLIVLLFAFNVIVFLLFGLWAVILILGAQLLIIVFANRIYARMGQWTIDGTNRQVYLLQLLLTPEEFENIRKRKPDIARLKSEIYERTFALNKEPSCEDMSDVLFRYGIMCSPENISSKTVDVYDIVARAAKKFDVSPPKIVISSSVLPNAGASGISSRRGVILITGGLLSQLNEDEILNVVGHEIGHLNGRDPLFLFMIISVEFLLRLTVFFPLFLISPLLYLIISMGIIFFIAKFFEARADLYSAMKIGQPKVLAESLRKIGFQRLQFERESPLRSWFRWDTHPPLYFRIERLENMSTPVQVKHPLLQSVKDVLRGLRSAFG